MLTDGFERADIVSLRLGSQVHTRVDRLPVQQHRAGPALTRLAAVLDAEITHPPQDFQQALAREGFYIFKDIVDQQL
jgi:hypothetical protein